MPKTVYLLGAGASCGVIPIVNQIEKEIDLVIDSIKLNKGYLIENHETIMKLHSSQHYNIIESIINDLTWLKNELHSHYSPDTLAKKFHLQNDIDKMTRLKRTLSIFFSYFELFKKFDKRYDALYSYILHSLETFSNQYVFLSWNYDNQMEIALSHYLQNEDLEKARKLLGTSIKNLTNDDKDGKQYLFKLNGTTSFVNSDNIIMNSSKYENSFDELEKRINIQLFINDLYTQLKSIEMDSLISFAFERDKSMEQNSENGIINKASKAVSQCNNLVIIGYSFPQINRQYDKRLINSMTNLVNIYIQDPNADSIAEIVNDLLPEERWKLKENIKTLKNTDQFYIPQL